MAGLEAALAAVNAAREQYHVAATALTQGIVAGVASGRIDSATGFALMAAVVSVASASAGVIAALDGVALTAYHARVDELLARRDQAAVAERFASAN